jgi:CubicO group peptidase (beta-lactamase class C family)
MPNRQVVSPRASVTLPSIAMQRLNHLIVLCLAVALWHGCRTAPEPQSSPFRSEKLSGLDALIEQGISEKRMPGAVLWVEHRGAVYQKAYGQRAIEPAAEPMTEDTIFDSASLTKVVATTPAIMLLVERGQIDLDAPVSRYVEEFRREGKEAITVRQLLTHVSGLRAGLSPRPEGSKAAIVMACQEKLVSPPGSTFLYSDINFILLGEIVARVSGYPLERFVADEVFRPLKMRDTRYAPFSTDRARIAPTDRDGTNFLRGVVHDPTARRMDGVAGHAGVFSTAADLARFARMMLNHGHLDGVRLFKPETVALMTSVQTPPDLKAKRGLGWDIDTGFSRRGEHFPVGSYGHTGFTGTAMWIDPSSKTFWILLSNRVHPDGKGNVIPVQRAVSTLAAQAVGLEGSTGTNATVTAQAPAP